MLFHCGAETTVLSSATATNLSLAHYASKINGLVVSAEHRYFGESLPFGNDSYTRDNIRFLRVEQTLRDYVTIIQHVQETMKLSALDGVVVFGGSYGGFLSYLMRVHYPTVVNGSIATAAATCSYGDVPDDTWYSLVSDTYQHYEVVVGDDVLHCGEEVRLGFDHIYKCIFNNTCAASLKDQLNLCQSVASISDGFLLIYYAKYAFSAAVQFNYPYRWLPFRVANPLFAICQPSLPIFRARLGMELLYNASHTTPCFTFNYTSNSQVGIEEKPFQYVTCTDFPQPIGGVGIFSIPQPVNFTRVANSCQTRWGIKPSLDWWKSFVQEPLLKSGSNIAFVNGGYDPVRGYSPYRDLTSTIRVFNVPRMAHVQDLLYPARADSADVNRVRDSQLMLIRQWVSHRETSNDFKVNKPHAQFAAPPTVKDMCLHPSPRR